MTPDGDPDGLRRAWELLAIGRAEAALPLAQQAVLSDPQDPTALATLAECEIELGMLDRAATTADRAVTASPDTPWPHRIRARALSLQGDRKGAVHSAAEAARLDPDSAGTLAELAGHLAHDRQRRAAAEAIDRARSLAPHDPAVAVQESYVAIQARRWPDAEAAARRALEARPDDPDALNNLGVALERQGRRAEALDLYASSAREAPSGVGADNARESARRLAGVATISAIGVAVLVGLRQAGTAAFDSVPGSWKGPAIGFGVVVVAGVIVMSERAKKRDLAQLSEHGRRMVDDARRQDIQRRREEMRSHETAFAAVLVGCVVVAAASAALVGSDALPVLVVAGILGTIMALSIVAGRMAEAE